MEPPYVPEIDPKVAKLEQNDDTDDLMPMSEALKDYFDMSKDNLKNNSGVGLLGNMNEFEMARVDILNQMNMEVNETNMYVFLFDKTFFRNDLKHIEEKIEVINGRVMGLGKLTSRYFVRLFSEFK